MRIISFSSWYVVVGQADKASLARRAQSYTPVCICTYKAITEEKNYLISQGFIIRNQSLIDGVPKFVPFSNSFLHKLGCQFYFKDTGKVIKLLSYSERGENLQYKLKLVSKKSEKSSTVKAALGQKINIAAYDFDSDVIEYELVVNMP